MSDMIKSTGKQPEVEEKVKEDEHSPPVCKTCNNSHPPLTCAYDGLDKKICFNCYREGHTQLHCPSQKSKPPPKEQRTEEHIPDSVMATNTDSTNAEHGNTGRRVIAANDRNIYVDATVAVDSEPRDPAITFYPRSTTSISSYWTLEDSSEEENMPGHMAIHTAGAPDSQSTEGGSFTTTDERPDMPYPGTPRLIGSVKNVSSVISFLDLNDTN